MNRSETLISCLLPEGNLPLSDLYQAWEISGMAFLAAIIVLWFSLVNQGQNYQNDYIIKRDTQGVSVWPVLCPHSAVHYLLYQWFHHCLSSFQLHPSRAWMIESIINFQIDWNTLIWGLLKIVFKFLFSHVLFFLECSWISRGHKLAYFIFLLR